MLKVRDVMTRSVVGVSPETPLKDVARLLVGHGISGLPVIAEGGVVVGVVSEADFLLKERDPSRMPHRPLSHFVGESARTRATVAKMSARTAGEAMTSPAITIEAERPLHEAAALIVERQVNRLPVVLGGVIVGIVTRADLVKAYLRPDDDIAEDIREDVLLRTMCLNPDRFDVSVAQGVARVRGQVEQRAMAADLVRLVGMVPGVVDTEIEVSWEFDPRTAALPGGDFVSPFTAK